MIQTPRPARIVLWIVMIMGSIQGPADRIHAQTPSTPVVFVHGLGGLGTWFDPLAAALSERFHIDPIQPYSLGSGAPYGDQAAVLGSYLLGWTGRSDLVAVGHSNGGVVVREYARQTPSSLINRHLSVGSPHSGARLAWSAQIGELQWWSFYLSAVIANTLYVYKSDPDWPWLWFSGTPALMMESMSYALGDFALLALPVALSNLFIDYPPVTTQMWPGSSFLQTLNSSGNLAQEAQRIPVARVGLSTQYHPQLMPWRAVVRQSPSFNPYYDDLWALQWELLRQELISLTYAAYWYYSFHWDWNLSSSAWMWLDVWANLLSIPGDWEGLIGSAGPGHQSDGIVPWSSSEYPGGTRNVQLTYWEKLVYHIDQLSPVSDPENDPYWNLVYEVMSDDFGIPFPPPPLTVSMSGPASIQEEGDYTWTAHPQSGTGEYSYAWYQQVDYWWPRGSATCHYQTDWVLVGTGQAHSGFVGLHDLDFRLSVVVQSGDETASKTIRVLVGDGSQECPQ